MSDNKLPSIFISHSSKDLVVARAVRNILEDLGHHALLLGLLILDKSTEQEILDFIESEIQLRDWLIFLDSDNSRASKWVQFEIDKAEEYEKVFYTISVDRFVNDDRYAVEHAVHPCVKGLSQSIRIVLPEFGDEDSMALVESKLKAEGYEVMYDSQVDAADWGIKLPMGVQGQNFMQQMQSMNTDILPDIPIEAPELEEVLTEGQIQKLLDTLHMVRVRMLENDCT